MPVPDASAEELAAWFEEFHRLIAEAADRFQAGQLRPALASLAAVPPVHRLLVEGCGELLNPSPADVEMSGRGDGQMGLYL